MKLESMKEHQDTCGRLQNKIKEIQGTKQIWRDGLETTFSIYNRLYLKVNISSLCTIKHCTTVRYLPGPQSWSEEGLNLEDSPVQGVAKTAQAECTELRGKREDKTLRTPTF